MGAESARRYVAMIFDDGPVEEQTNAFLELLAREQVEVSFAYVGQNVAAHPELARAAFDAGHELLNHSYTHPHLKELDDAAIEREVRETQEAVERATGKKPRWFWAPFGEWDARIEAAVRRAGLEHYPAQRFHFISTDDWNREVPAETIRQKATTGIQEKTIILCHEWREETFAELPRILTELKRQGCELVTFSQLLELNEAQK